MSWGDITVPNPPPDNTDTANFEFRLPDYGGDPNTWGYGLNGNWYAVDVILDEIKTTADSAMPKAGGEFSGAPLFAASIGIGSLAKPAATVHISALSLHQPSGAVLASIANDGRMTAVDYSATSDARLKHDIVPHDIEILARIALALRPVAFRWNSDNRVDDGLIAQDVQKVAPWAVTESDGQLAISWPKITLMLIGAIQVLARDTLRTED